MSTVMKVVKYQAKDAVCSRWLIAYALFFFLVTDGLLRFTGDPAKAQLSLISVVLFVVPLVALVFGTVYLYNAREFIELLLAQPVNRRKMYAGLYLGLTLPLVLAFAMGIGVPFFINGTDVTMLSTLPALIGAGVVLTCIFAAVATLIGVHCEDRLRGLGAAIAIWLLLTVVYDGFVLFVLSVFPDYPLERATLGLMMANPIDIIRVALLVRFDGAAMMGYTGAVFLKFFDGMSGVVVTMTALALWIAAPVMLGARQFRRKDF